MPILYFVLLCTGFETDPGTYCRSVEVTESLVKAFEASDPYVARGQCTQIVALIGFSGGGDIESVEDFWCDGGKQDVF